MRFYLLFCFGLVAASSASAQVYSYQEVVPAYVAPTTVQESIPNVDYAGGTYSSAPFGSITTTNYSPPVVSSAPLITSTPSAESTNDFPTTASTAVSPGLAQQKAQQAASASVRGHLNNHLGGARYEGVGWSNVSPQSAIQNCCYWGTRPVAQIGISQGRDGCWYACVLYQ